MLASERLIFDFRVPGIPSPPCTNRRLNRRIRRRYFASEAWRARVTIAAAEQRKQQKHLEWPLQTSVNINMELTAPKILGHTQPITALAQAIIDALVDAKVIASAAQVNSLLAVKEISCRTSGCGAYVSLWKC